MARKTREPLRRISMMNMETSFLNQATPLADASKRLSYHFFATQSCRWRDLVRLPSPIQSEGA